jgi:hypothetical protein
LLDAPTLNVSGARHTLHRYSDAGKEAQGQFLDLFELEFRRVKPVKVIVKHLVHPPSRAAMCQPEVLLVLPLRARNATLRSNPCAQAHMCEHAR